jgi:hypothetical protein
MIDWKERLILIMGLISLTIIITLAVVTWSVYLYEDDQQPPRFDKDKCGEFVMYEFIDSKIPFRIVENGMFRQEIREISDLNYWTAVCQEFAIYCKDNLGYNDLNEWGETDKEPDYKFTAKADSIFIQFWKGKSTEVGITYVRGICR